MKQFSLSLPLLCIPNIRWYYLLVVVRNFWFISGIWIFYWLSFMDYDALGLYQAIAFGVGLALEIPCGALSDMIGKKKTLIGSGIASGIGGILIGLATSGPMIFVGFLLVQIGWSMFSSTGDALAYDSLADIKKEKEFDKVLSTANILAISTSVIATFLGGFIYALNFRLPYLLWGCGYLVGIGVTCLFKEPKTDTEKFSFPEYLIQLRDGIAQLIKPGVRAFLVVIIALRGVIYFYDLSMLKPAVAISFGFDAKTQSTLFAVLGIFGALAVRQIPLLRNKVSDIKGLYLLSLFLGLGFIFTMLPWGTFGVLPMIAIAIAGSLSYPWVMVVINKEIPSKYRSTTLSTTNLITKIPYVFAAVITGKVIQAGHLHTVNLTIGLGVITSIIVSGILYKMKRQGHFELIKERLVSLRFPTVS